MTARPDGVPADLDPDRLTVVLDRVVVGPDSRRRITESLETALAEGEGRAERGRARPRHRPGEPRLPLPVLRDGAGPAAAAALLVQPSPRGLPRVQGLRQHPALRRGPRGARSDPEPGRRRGGALDASLGPLVPEAAPQGGQEARGGREPAVRGALRRGSGMGLRRRRRAHRHPGLLRGGGVVPLQAPRPRLPLALPQPVAAARAARAAAQAGGARGPRGRRHHRRARRPDHRGPGRALRDACRSPPGGGAWRATCSACCAPSSPSCSGWASATSRSAARRARSPAARPSGSISPTSSAPSSSARSTSWTSPPSGFTRATPRAWPSSAGELAAAGNTVVIVEHDRSLHRGGRLRDRDGAGLGRSRRRRGLRGHPGGVPQGPALAHRALPQRPRHDPAAARAPRGPPRPRRRGRAREQPEGRHDPDPAAHPHLRDRGIRLRQIHPRARHALPRGGPALQGGLRGRGGPTTSCGVCSISRASASSTRSRSAARPGPIRSRT